MPVGNNRVGEVFLLFAAFFFCFPLFLPVDRRPENHETPGLGNNQLHCLAKTLRQVFCNGKQLCCNSPASPCAGSFSSTHYLSLVYNVIFVSSELVGK